MTACQYEQFLRNDRKRDHRRQPGRAWGHARRCQTASTTDDQESWLAMSPWRWSQRSREPAAFEATKMP
jgi:hypothetical protein